ncbi:MAG: SDR family oxidoreductase [Chromatiales bacterium]|jgi:nucleoside-diphosphate-sugar epimerase|nr:SDR family oxidoreductase [Chromatiales bacterium]
MGVRGKALVAGALGVVGRNFVHHLLQSGQWDVVGLSRSAAEPQAGYQHIPVDLLDPDDCARALSSLSDVTHIFYAARTPDPDFATEAELNLRLLRNLIEAVEPVAPGLAHVNVVHGTKWYGCQIGPFKTPSLEDDPRQLRPCFYYDQQDYLSDRQKGKSWSWSTLRPPLVCGFSSGYPHNLLTSIALYASVCRELGQPLRFPGSQACYDTLYQAVDATLLAKAMAWAATTPGCANQPFNITNGDTYRWVHLWPQIARFFDMEIGPPQEISLRETMPRLSSVWEGIVDRHQLKDYRYEDLGNWKFADLIFSLGWDDISSTVKSRQCGFAEVEDTTMMFLRLLEQLRGARVIP